MKVTFRGWSREVTPHTHELQPVVNIAKKYLPGDMGPLDWHSGSVVFAKADGLSLSGNFLLKFEMEQQELANWLTAFAKEQPKEALVLIAAAQAEALIALGSKVPT